MNRSTRIRAARAEYLAMRRTLGYQLTDPEHLLQQFVDYLDTIGADSITIDNALTWARQPAGADPYWWSARLSTIRVFARYLHAVDPDLAQPIPPRLLPTRPCGRCHTLFRPAGSGDHERHRSTAETTAP